MVLFKGIKIKNRKKTIQCTDISQAYDLLGKNQEAEENISCVQQDG